MKEEPTSTRRVETAHEPSAPRCDAGASFQAPEPLTPAWLSSPLAVPRPEPEIVASARLPLLILGGAAVLSACIVLGALQLRRARAPIADPVPADVGARTATIAPAAQLASVPQPAAAAPSAARSIPAIAVPGSVAPSTAVLLDSGASRRVAKRPRAAARDVQVGPALRAAKEQPAARVNPWRLPPQRPRVSSFTRFQPTRGQVITAMQRVTPAVYACFEDGRGFALVRFSVRGETGRVTTARVLGQTGRVSSCVARAVQRARLPRFHKKTLEITFPFKH
jgi:hypothetical protein